MKDYIQWLGWCRDGLAFYVGVVLVMSFARADSEATYWEVILTPIMTGSAFYTIKAGMPNAKLCPRHRVCWEISLILGLAAVWVVKWHKMTARPLSITATLIIVAAFGAGLIGGWISYYLAERKRRE